MSVVDDFKARQRARRLGTCRHFTGLMEKACREGIAYADVRDPVAKPVRLPCLAGMDGSPPLDNCLKCSFKTPAEVDAEESEFKAATGRVLNARAAIIASKQPSGVIPCPNCGGQLAFSVSSYNGHVHGRCSTPDCARWME